MDKLTIVIKGFRVSQPIKNGIEKLSELKKRKQHEVIRMIVEKSISIYNKTGIFDLDG